MIDLANIQCRDPQRAEHAELIEQFLASGGRIQVIGHIERMPIKPTNWNGSVTPNESRRKEFLRVERELAEHGKALAAIGLTVEEAQRQLRKTWKGRVTLTTQKLEQLAARFGYHYHCTNRGRP